MFFFLSVFLSFSLTHSRTHSLKRVPRYPEEYFARLAPPRPFIKQLISRLRSDDIYNQVSVRGHFGAMEMGVHPLHILYINTTLLSPFPLQDFGLPAPGPP